MGYFKSLKIGLGTSTACALIGGVVATFGGVLVGVALGLASTITTGSLASFVAGYGIVSAVGATIGGLIGSGISAFLAHNPPQRFHGRTAMVAGLALTDACSYGSLNYLYNKAAAKPAASVPAEKAVYAPVKPQVLRLG